MAYVVETVLRYLTPAPFLRRQIADASERRDKLPEGRESLRSLREAYQTMINERTQALKFWPWRRERRQK